MNCNITCREKFIEKASFKYNKFDYSKFEYIDCYTKSIIICPEHGEFLQSPTNHINSKYGCSMCGDKIGRLKRLKCNKEEFVKIAKGIHGNKFDYSKFVYENKKTSSMIICPVHGEFFQSQERHVKSLYGCDKCARKNRVVKKRYTNESFIKKSNKIHCNKYNYSKFVYINCLEESVIICPIHGEFLQVSHYHLRGAGCPKCGNKYTNEIFIKKANKTHNNKYDYSDICYETSDKKIKIICPVHGFFLQVPKKHLNGDGCPKCNESKGEKRIRIFLEEQNVKYITQKRFKDCIDKRVLPFDFYLPKYNLCIEYDGQQHFEKINGMNNKVFSEEESVKLFKTNQKHDRMKDEYCHSNDIKLLRISYLDFNNIEAILRECFNNNFDMSFNS